MSKEINNQCENCNLNRRHKDSMFRAIFNNKKSVIELYNAITGESYGANTKVEFQTIEDVVFEKLKNDIAFTLDNKFIVLIEHQSTTNKNMAIRELIYYSYMLQKIDRKELYLSSRKVIPEPVFIVLYNGVEDDREHWQIELKDNFEDGEKCTLNLVVDVYNINIGKNKDILKQCKTLSDYSYYVAEIRRLQKHEQLDDNAIKRFNKECISKGILSEFLKEHGTEVCDMICEALTDEDIKEIYTENGRLKGKEEGKEEGRAVEKLEIASRMKKMAMSISDIVKATGLTEKEIKEL